ncbi:tyrosine-type recombinase/integrase [Sphingobacterium sp. UDSM-2020]|uniref:tyrosine-type recombinase/integrase n=1 Tax=Sphingobacterium sp. UDSM-2020 TaxID=2795738 RepID=UPI001935EF6A|nr:tyrosine-type recombinase/integrase [Sphingobacterium sp. UDSM-2020]QQD15229.1 tyrosine-type recombinase/integrase [Sphingobacterium sp. UDSM-2020]
MNDHLVTIKKSNDLKKRAYISIYVKGRRIKEYTGIKLGLNIKPNSANSIKQRDELLTLLEYEFKKAIEFNKYPNNETIIHEKKIKPLSVKELLDLAISNKKKANLTSNYVKHLERLTEKLKAFLTTDELNGNINNLQRGRIQDFMNEFNSTASNYMISRRHIKAVFAEINKDLDYDTSIITKTDKRKATPKLHKIYSDEQLTNVLQFLKNNHEELHLCCLMSYGCLLRPHNEIRLLKRHHIKNNITEIHLSGNENKGKKIRTVPIPNYVRELLLKRLEGLSHDDNIFTQRPDANNPYYFSTAWTRMFKLMEKAGIIEKNQTIYSFRHTASVNVYKKTKDLHILQQLLGHSDMIVTLKYLRGLGVHNADELKHVMPEL